MVAMRRLLDTYRRVELSDDVSYILPDHYDCPPFALYDPPWHHRMSDGSLGRAYGPRAVSGSIHYSDGAGAGSAYLSAMREYESGRYGGGLWDHEEEEAENARLGRPRLRRADHRHARDSDRVKVVEPCDPVVLASLIDRMHASALPDPEDLDE